MSQSSSFNSNQQRVRKAVEEINAEQTDKKTRILLAYEIKNREKEITFLTNKISMVQKEIHQIDSSIDSINSGVRTSRANLSDIRKDSSKNANEWTELGNMQKDIQNMLLALPQLKGGITQNKKDIQELTQTLKPLEEEWIHICEERHELDESVSKADVTLSSIEQEIAIMHETRGLLYGILPQGYDTDLIEDISVNFGQCIQNYYNEIESQIAGVKEKMAEMERQIEFEQNTLKQIRPEKISLEREAQRVLDAALMNESKLLSELEQIRSNHQDIASRNNNLNEEVANVSLQIKDIDGSITTQQNTVLDLQKKYETLLALKNKIDKIDKIDKEIERIKAAIWRAKTEENITSSMLVTINNIKSDMDAMNDSLKSIYGEFNKQLDNFDAAVEWL